MTISEWLHSSNNKLNKTGIETARLDCLVLLEDALDKNRGNLLAHPEQEIPPKTEVELNNKITQRSQHVPLAYIRGKAEFYGREFAVNNHVMVPRPETETMIEMLKSLELPSKPTILDVGTGPGVLAVIAKTELPNSNVYATDISANALNIAQKNAQNLGANVHFYRGDLLSPLATVSFPLSAILANLPYVPSEHPTNKAAQFEPKTALFAGKDGLHVYRRFWAQVAGLKPKPEYVITESLDFQHDKLQAIAAKAGYNLQTTKSLVQLFALNATL